MKQLTGLDAAFLAMESRTVYGHVGSIIILDPASTGEKLTLPRLIAHIESRLHLLPPYRRRLVRVPFDLDQPYWVDDEHFDIEFHVRELALPPPGNDRQLAEQVARLHARPLDRSRPLWETYLIHGLPADRVGVYTKIHHSAIDGVSGNEILTALLDLSPEGRPELAPPPPWRPEPRPPVPVMLARSALATAVQPVRAVRFAAALARSVPGLVTNVNRPRLPVLDRFVLDAVAPKEGQEMLARSGLRAPRTPFNGPVTAHRRFAAASVALDDVRPVRAAFGMTVNDVVMAMCAGALRRYLAEHDALPEEPLIAGVPVSVRTDEQRADLGNRVSAMFAVLPTHRADPADRLRAVHAAMLAAKEQYQALPADLLADVTQFAMPAVAGLAAQLGARLRLVERISPFNLIISNVPGPNIPLYLAGYPLGAMYPVSAVADGQGLNITVLGYRGRLHFGLVACRELVPDLQRIADLLVEELAVLGELASPPAPATKRAARTRAGG